MRFEVFQRGLLGRHDIVAVDMIQYSGLWGLCFSHHHPHNNHPRYAADTSTEGVFRYLDTADISPLAGYTVTTHHFDADSFLPVWSFLHPAAALDQRGLLERVARCGDFFIYLDDESARLNFIIEALQQRLLESAGRGQRLVNEALTAACFEWLLPRWPALLADADGGRDLWEEPMSTMVKDMAYLAAPGRVTELWDRHVSLVEADHAPDAHALNSVCRNDLLVLWPAGRGAAPRIDVRPAIGWYDIRSLPHRPRYDLDALAAALNAAEAAAGHTLGWRHKPSPAWLRSPGSGLSQGVFLDTIKTWLNAEPEAHVPASYRADVREVFRQRPQHAIIDSHTRFAGCRELRYRPGACYEGLYPVNLVAGDVARLAAMSEGSADAAPALVEAGLTLAAAHKAPLQFAVSDDFYWNRTTPQPLTLTIDFEDRAPGSFWVEYDTWRDPFTPTEPVALAGDGAAHSVTWHLSDAHLGNSQDWGDLRLVRSAGSAMGVRQVRLKVTG